MMRVRVNGAVREIPEPLSVRGLVQHFGLDDGPVAVEVNGAVVPRAQHGERQLEPDDVIEIVHFVGGG